MRVINFYRANDDFGGFSNFSDHPLEIDGNFWPTSEHYYQAMKFDDPTIREMIRIADGPMKAKKLGNKKDFPIRPDWEQVKDRIMYDVVMLKVRQHEDIYALLISTGDAILVEHTTNDAYWGDGGDGSGKNMLGKTLMRIRDELNGGTV